MFLLWEDSIHFPAPSSRSKWSCCSDTSSPIRRFPFEKWDRSVQRALPVPSKEAWGGAETGSVWSWLHKRTWRKTLSRDSPKSSWHQRAVIWVTGPLSKNLLLRKSHACAMYTCICKDTATTISTCSRKKPQIEANKHFPRPSNASKQLALINRSE